MRVEVKVPQLPESVAEATLVSWHKKAGAAVARDENLIDVETDKVVLELPAPASGALVEILKGRGSTGRGREVIAIIDTEAKAAAASAPAQPAKAAATVPPSPAPAEAAAPAPAASPAPQAPAMPSARKMMAEQGIAPGEVAGTGRGGRVTKGDVLAATAQAAPR